MYSEKKGGDKMKKFIRMLLISFVILFSSGCLSTIRTNKDVVNGIMSLYKDYDIEVLDDTKDGIIIKIRKGIK